MSALRTLAIRPRNQRSRQVFDVARYAVEQPFCNFLPANLSTLRRDYTSSRMHASGSIKGVQLRVLLEAIVIIHKICKRCAHHIELSSTISHLPGIYSKFY